MNDIYLHGELGQRFGAHHRFDVQSPAEAVSALGQLEGFLETIREGRWEVVVGDDADGLRIEEEELQVGLGDTPLHILPALEGAGNGTGKAILGVAMIAVAWWNPMGWGAAATMLGAAGAGMAMAGVAMMMSPVPETGSYDSEKANEQSFLFNGPVNVNKQGVSVPLIYGEVVTGSVVVSAGIRADDIPVSGSSSSNDPELLVGK